MCCPLLPFSLFRVLLAKQQFAINGSGRYKRSVSHRYRLEFILRSRDPMSFASFEKLKTVQ